MKYSIMLTISFSYGSKVTEQIKSIRIPAANILLRILKALKLNVEYDIYLYKLISIVLTLLLIEYLYHESNSY